MKAAVISFVLIPLVLMAWTTRRFGYRILHTLVASVVGEVLGLFLYASYKEEKVRLILSGKASGAVTYVGTEAPRGMVEALLKLAGFGIAIGLVVLAAQWVYARARSA
jgi:hypothetical protein